MFLVSNMHCTRLIFLENKKLGFPIELVAKHWCKYLICSNVQSKIQAQPISGEGAYLYIWF